VNNTIKLKDYPSIVRNAITTSQPDTVFIDIPEINGLLVSACHPNENMRQPQHYYQLFINQGHVFDIYSWLLEHGGKENFRKDLMCALVEANSDEFNKEFIAFDNAMNQFNLRAEGGVQAVEGADSLPVLIGTTGFMITRVDELDLYMGRISTDEGIVYRSSSSNLNELTGQMKQLGRRELHRQVVAGEYNLDLTNLGKPKASGLPPFKDDRKSNW